MGNIHISRLPLSGKICLAKYVLLLKTAAVGLTLLGSVFVFSGCHNKDQPKFRIGSFFGSPTGMTFPDPNNLGIHRSKDRNSKDEKTGMLYTCKGGFIDLSHLREGVDRTAYLADLTKKNLTAGNTEFTYRIIEPSIYTARITLPGDWDKKSEISKAKIIHEASVYLGQYFAHTSMIWHEIITWYGYSSTGIFPENISSFSWEDTYSDILGTNIAVEAMLTDSSNFDIAVTRLIDRSMKELDVQPAEVAKKAAEQIKGEWFTGNMYIFVNMKKHNFDVGFSDGYVSPLLVPGICPYVEPVACPTPDMKFLKRLGMKLELEIEPKSMERKQIFREINLTEGRDIMIPKIHFPMILEQISRRSE